MRKDFDAEDVVDMEFSTRFPTATPLTAAARHGRRRLERNSIFEVKEKM